jgi:membrane protein DedA with SNARE-associated domain
LNIIYQDFKKSLSRISHFAHQEIYKYISLFDFYRVFAILEIMLNGLSSSIIQFIHSAGYFGVFFLMMLNSALIPVPSEVTMTFAGYLAQAGTLSFPLVVLAGATGDLCGALIAYAIGYFLEENVILNLINKYGKFILLSKHEYLHAVNMYKKYGSGITFFCRLIPGVRSFISVPAGLSEMNIWKFALFTFLGSILWTGMLAYFGFYLGSHWDSIGPVFHKFQLVIITVFFLLVAYYIYHKVKKNKEK